MKKQVQKIKENKGFSMIELIIVVAIMAILVGIIGAALIPYMEKSRASKDKSALDSLYTAYASALTTNEDASKIVSAGNLTADGKAAVESLMEGGSIDNLFGKLKSKQFKGLGSSGGPTITYFYNADGTYGITIKSSGYADVTIDNKGTESPVGVKTSTSSK